MSYMFVDRKKGRGAYRIKCRYDGKEYYKYWEIPEGWSKRAIEREIKKLDTAFTEAVHKGEVLRRQDRKALAEQKAYEESQKITFENYVNTVYMPQKTIINAENTRDSYQSNLDHYIFPAIGKCKIADIKPAQISALLLDMQKLGRAISSVIKVYGLLNNIFKTAYLDDTITVNPMYKVERPKARKAERTGKVIDAFTVEEIKKIKALAENEQLKWKLYINLLIDTGCRNGEAIGLTWKCVDLKNNKVRLEQNVCYTSYKGIYVDTIKNGKPRTNDVSPYTASLLKEMKDYQKSHGIDTEYVFIQDDRGEVMHPQSPGRFLSRFGERNGFVRCRPHKFRHSVVSIMITSGVDIATVAEIVGDNIDTILRIYTHSNEASKAKAVELYQSILSTD